MSLRWTKQATLVVSTARHLAPYTLREIKALGYEVVAHSESVITIKGTMFDAMRLNLWLRTGIRVLMSFGHTEACNLDELYDYGVSLPWEEWLGPDEFITVHGSSNRAPIRDTRMPMLRLKDAIVDRLRDHYGRRPDSGSGFHGAAVFIRWHRHDLRIFIDTTGAPMPQRGYRLWPGDAPLRESLAAACVMATNWNWNSPFIAPMCGSGTPAIEAALIAKNRAPGLKREHFAFMSLVGFTGVREDATQSAPESDHKEDEAAEETAAVVSPTQWWEKLRQEAVDGERTSSELPPIVANDVSGLAVEGARANAERAGVGDLIDFSVCDFADTPVPEGFGVILLNPEYGSRLGDAKTLMPTYRRIGELVTAHPTYRSAVLTDSPQLADAIGVKSDDRIPFFNGPIECRLLIYNERQKYI